MMKNKAFSVFIFLCFFLTSCFKSDPVSVNYQFVRFSLDLVYENDFSFVFYKTDEEGVYKSNIYNIAIHNRGRFDSRPLKVSTSVQTTLTLVDNNSQFEIFYSDCIDRRLEPDSFCIVSIRAIRRGYGELEGELVVESGDLVKTLSLSALNEFPERPFVSYWRTFEDGKSERNQIELPLRPGVYYDFIVDWGDGKESHITSWDDPQKLHTYEKPGEYRIVLSGTLGELGPLVKNDTKKIVSEYSHQCLLYGGAVKCWGGNFRGRLGHGDEVKRNFEDAPVIYPNFPVEDIALGSSHTCFLISGFVKCVGGGGGTGRLGFDTDEDILSLEESFYVSIPRRVERIFSHLNSTCALTERDELYCWGDTWRNDTNQFSPGSDRTRYGFNTMKGVVDVLLYDDFMCTLHESQSMMCWGSDLGRLFSIFQPGVSSSTLESGASSILFSFMDGPPATYFSKPMKSISVGRFNDLVDSSEIHRRRMCALEESGSFYCWGGASNKGLNLLGYENELGFGISHIHDFALSTPIYDQVLSPPQAKRTTLDQKVLKIVHGGINPTIQPGPNAFTCLLLEDGTLRCWGGMHNGDVIPFDDPYLVSFDEPIIDISSIDRANKVCGLLESGRSFCFGGDYAPADSPFMYGDMGSCSGGFCYADEVVINEKIDFFDHDMNKLYKIESWGTNAWGSFRQMFRDYTLNPKILSQASDRPNTASLFTIEGMFMGASLEVDLTDLFSEDYSHFLFAKKLFANAEVKLLNISQWPRFSSTEKMFYQAKILEGSDGDGVLKTEFLDNMEEMFFETEGIEHLNLTEMATGYVRSMKRMFYNTDFNQDITGWDVSSVRDMREMFKFSNFNQPIGSWVTSSLNRTDGMFEGNNQFNQNLNTWNMVNVTSIARMFKNASSFNGDISNWNTVNVINMSEVFSGAESFNMPLVGWNTSNVWYMSGMFKDAVIFNEDISTWNLGNVQNMSSLFKGASDFDQPVGGWGLNQLRNAHSMFEGAESFNQDLSNWSLNNLIDARSMFEGATAFNQDMTSFSGNRVINSSSMFKNATSFNGNLGNVEFENNRNTSSMFEGASSFNQNISGFGLPLNLNARDMFLGATAFNNGGSPGIQNWDVSRVEDMSGMFAFASSFSRPLDNWNVGRVVDFSSMFDGVGYNRDLSGWAPCSASNMDRMFNYDYGHLPPSVSYDFDLSTWTPIVNSSRGNYASGYEETSCFSTLSQILSNFSSERSVESCLDFDLGPSGSSSFSSEDNLPFFEFCNLDPVP